ncbi:MAG: hypothetical protein ACLTBV_06735 [Enterocloster bolteae]
MPLVEPLESREVYPGWRDFAVVIDTSMSCSGELVQAVPGGDHHDVLSESESYLPPKVHVHVIQCDDAGAVRRGGHQGRRI